METTLSMNGGAGRGEMETTLSMNGSRKGEPTLSMHGRGASCSMEKCLMLPSPFMERGWG
jgi:hypothetical protein